MSIIKANGQQIDVSHPDKVMFPDAGLTKMDLAEYYKKMASRILPFLKDRPLMLHRYPNGIDGKEFYQKDEPGYFPDWIDTVEVDLKEKGKRQFVMCNNEATLLYLVNQASITPHVWLSKQQDLDRPDRMIFDLDPPKGNFEWVQDAAKDLKKTFARLNMHAFVMTTGSKGMHVVLPLDGKSRFKETREFAKTVAEKLAGDYPDKYTTETRTSKRRGRVFLDYLRNAYGQTAVAPYSIRARKNAPVATPLAWDEVGSSSLDPRKYHHGNIFRRLANKTDPWKDISNQINNIEKAFKKLKK